VVVEKKEGVCKHLFLRLIHSKVLLILNFYLKMEEVKSKKKVKTSLKKQKTNLNHFTPII